MEKSIKTEKKVKRSPNWEQNEKDLLSKLVLEKLEIIEDARIDTNTNKKKRDAWNAIHTLYNSVSLHNRTLEQIQSQWRKTKSLAKTKNSAYIRQIKQTGGGPAPKPLDSVEEELISRLPKHFEIDTNAYDSNSQLSSSNNNLSLISEPKTDDEMFNAKDDTPIKKPIAFTKKRNIKCQCGLENENAKRIKLLDLGIKQKELEIKSLEEDHNIQKRRNEILKMQEVQEKEEHILRVTKIKLEIQNLKN